MMFKNRSHRVTICCEIEQHTLASCSVAGAIFERVKNRFSRELRGNDAGQPIFNAELLHAGPFCSGTAVMSIAVAHHADDRREEHEGPELALRGQLVEHRRGVDLGHEHLVDPLGVELLRGWISQRESCP